MVSKLMCVGASVRVHACVSVHARMYVPRTVSLDKI